MPAHRLKSLKPSQSPQKQKVPAQTALKKQTNRKAANASSLKQRTRKTRSTSLNQILSKRQMITPQILEASHCTTRNSKESALRT